MARNAAKLAGREIPAGKVLSTSTNRGIAEMHGGYDGGSRVLLHMKVPKGTPAINMDQFGEGEDEILLSGKGKLRVTGVTPGSKFKPAIIHGTWIDG